MDVERVRVQQVARAAQGPAAAGLEQRVLHVLGNQSDHEVAALGPLLQPPAAIGECRLQGRDRGGIGHAGAIVSGSSGTAQAKKEALEAAGVKVGKTPSETAELMREILNAL